MEGKEEKREDLGEVWVSNDIEIGKGFKSFKTFDRVGHGFGTVVENSFLDDFNFTSWRSWEGKADFLRFEVRKVFFWKEEALSIKSLTKLLEVTQWGIFEEIVLEELGI